MEELHLQTQADGQYPTAVIDHLSIDQDDVNHYLLEACNLITQTEFMLLIDSFIINDFLFYSLNEPIRGF